MSDTAGRNPLRFAAFSILALILALATVGVVGVIQNIRLKDAATRAIQYDVAVSSVGDDLRVVVLDLRFDHRNIVLGGPTNANINEFDDSWDALMADIDRLEMLDISGLNVPQPDELRALATAYYDAFRPSIALFTSDPVAFNQASEVGLAQLDELSIMADQINDVGEDLTAQSLAQVETAANRERWILLLLLTGVGLVGAVLLLSAARIVRQSQEANAAQAAASEQLENSLRMKTHFIADASHELRTPITLIRGNAELSLATAEDPEQRESLQEIYSESTRMAGLVNDLLFLARSDAGTLPLDEEYLPLGVLLARVSGPAEALAQQHGVRLQVLPGATGHVRGDPARLEQAILILIDNASKFSPADSVVKLSATTDSVHAQISVTDHGPGISEEEQERIFDRFYQVRDDARHRSGAGIGLSIARSIVEAHNCTITVASTPGQGATFTISIPLADS